MGYKKEGAPQVRASPEGLQHPEQEATNEETRPNERAPRKSPFLVLERLQFSGETMNAMNAKCYWSKCFVVVLQSLSLAIGFGRARSFRLGLNLS